jgi:hypothetical protein
MTSADDCSSKGARSRSCSDRGEREGGRKMIANQVFFLAPAACMAGGAQFLR